MSPLIVYTLDAIKNAVKEIPGLNPAEVQPILNRALLEEILAKSRFEENYAAAYKDIDFYRLDEQEIADYNKMVLGSDEWNDVLALLDRNKARTAERAQERHRLQELAAVFQTMPVDLETFGFRAPCDRTEEEMDFEAVPCPPAVIEERLLEKLELELNRVEDEKALVLIWQTLRSILSGTHSNTWRLNQMTDSFRRLTQTPNKPGAAINEKRPSFVNLLPASQRSCLGAPPVTALARALSDETPHQLACRHQRDAVFAPFEHLWMEQRLTFAKISDDVIAQVCNGMHKAPCQWNWKTTKARLTEAIGRWRSDEKKAKLKAAADGHKNSSSSSSSSSSTSSSSSSSTPVKKRSLKADAAPAGPHVSSS